MEPKDEAKIKQIALNRRARALAYAFLQRGHKAGIPDQFLRINQDQFKNILCDSYHGDTESISDFVYKCPESLLKIPFILIDGGDQRTRDMAGYAILFRLITCDKLGMYYSFRQIAHQFSTWETMNVPRNELAGQLKQYDILFMGEADPMKISVHTEASTFFDEVFHERLNYIRPTIISYTNPLSKEKIIRDDKQGQFFANFSVRVNSGSYLNKDGHFREGSKENPSGNYFRIRVRMAKNDR